MQANSTYIRVLASALSNSIGVKVVEGEHWAFDSQNKVLMYNPVTLLEKDVNVVRGLLIHEIGHVLHTQPVPSSDIFRDYPAINLVYNAFEDIRIEARLEQEFGDFAFVPLLTKNMSYAYSVFNSGAYNQLDPIEQVSGIALLANIIEYVRNGDHYYAFGYSDKSLSIGNFLKQIHNHLQTMVSPEVYAAAARIQKKYNWKHLRDEARVLPNFAAVQHFVDTRIFPDIKELFKNSQTNQSMLAEQQQGQTEEGENGIASSQKGASEAGVLSKTSDVPGEGVGAGVRRGQTVMPYAEASALVSPYTNYLTSRITSIMKENASIKFHGNRKNGKLLSRNITKLTLGEDRVFSKRNQIDSPLYHLVIALDGSGSMNEEKELNAYLGSVLAVDTFTKLRMKATVFTFSDSVQQIVTAGKMSEDFITYTSEGGGTCDDDMIYKVASFMRKNPEDDFFFIVIGDGVGNTLPPKEVEYIQSRGIAMALGIGPGSQAVVKAYPNGVYVADVSQVPQVILNTLHNIIHR